MSIIFTCNIDNIMLLFMPTPITPLIGVEITHNASQSDTHFAVGDWNMGVARYNSHVSWLTYEL